MALGIYLSGLASAVAKQPYRVEDSVSKLTTHAKGRQGTTNESSMLATYAWEQMLQQIPKATPTLFLMAVL